jgi:hypothetical protein
VWNGDIRISNCRLLPSAPGMVSVLYNNQANFDFGYPLGISHTVKVEDLIIDYSAVSDSTDECWLQILANFSKTQDGARLFFPYDVVFRNIHVTGRKQGVRLMKIQQPYEFNLEREGSYDGVRLQHNSSMIFDNIQLDKLPASPSDSADQVHFQLGDGRATAFADNNALYPKISFTNCENICAYFLNGIADVSFERCSIDRIVANNDKPFKGQLSFNNCDFSPNATDDSKAIYALDSELGTAFTDCTIHAPIVAGSANPESVDRYGFISLNKSLRHYHLNTKLGNDILRYIKEKNIKLLPQFIAMLKAHHALEEENVTE